MKLQGQKLRITLLGVLVAILSSFTSNAQDVESSLLWKIEGNGLSKPSYVFGTIHLICPDDFKMFDAAKTALIESDVVYLELDMDEPGFMGKMQQHMMNPGMKNFSSDLKPQDKEKIDAFFKENFGTGLDQLGIMKPFALMSMMYTKYLDCSAIESYEGTITKLAAEYEKEVKGFETVEFQMGLFDKIPQEEMIQWLVDGTDIQKNKDLFAGLVEAYLSKNTDNLYKYILKSSPEFAAYEDDLLVNRNKNWVPIIREVSQEQSMFIAVGSGHLGGKEGVLALLKKEGYTVSPVKI
ncbi:MAG: TraB/GumN family protein [bacterium]|nr:TraB/GumN family protein [bacterium]